MKKVDYANWINWVRGSHKHGAVDSVASGQQITSVRFVINAMAAVTCLAIIVSWVAGLLTTSLALIIAAALISWFFVLMAAESHMRNRFEQRRTSVTNASWPSIPAEKVLRGLARTAELRDTELGGHCERVAENSVLVGREMGLGDGSLLELYWGGVLHDLGKIAVADQTLNKASRLSEEELAEIRRHPAYGADLLNSLGKELNGIAAIVRYHHERWDGYGYPEGLKREELPLNARIVAVADVFEALTSSRPYRQPLRADQAMVYLRRSSGTHFDPAVVAVFESLFNAGQLQVATDAAPQIIEDSIHPSWVPGLSNAS